MEVRDSVLDFIEKWRHKTLLPECFFLRQLSLTRRRAIDWRKRYGEENQHNGDIPRSHQLEQWERDAIVKYYIGHPLEGYRRITYMMIDDNLVATSSATVYRVLKDAGVMRKWNGKNSKKGTGFKQPDRPHKHWHTDVSYINIAGTFYYLCAVLDGYSRYVVHWEIREKMETADIEIVQQRALEKFPGEKTRLISDNGPQFISRSFKEFVRISGLTHVRTSPFYPQSNGKIEKFHGTFKRECIRPKTPLTLEDAIRVTEEYIGHYNSRRLHSAIGYVTPKVKLNGNEEEVFKIRKQRLKAAEQRRLNNSLRNLKNANIQA
jgi:putative transposase